MSRPLWWFDILGRSLVGVIFLVAAVPKLFDINGFSEVINAYGMLPDFLIMPSAIIIPILEIVLAIGVIFNRRREKIGSAMLLLLFIAVLSYAIYLGLDIDCGCFGPEDPEHTAFMGLRVALWRDLFMLLILIYSLWFWSDRNHFYQTIAGERK